MREWEAAEANVYGGGHQQEEVVLGDAQLDVLIVRNGTFGARLTSLNGLLSS